MKNAAAVLNSIDVSRSLFIVVSKSGTTLETLTNEAFVKDALVKAGLNPSKHMLTATSETSPLAKSDDYLAAFFMDDFIGGRYSSVSSVGGVILSLAFGPDVFARILDGMAEEDKLATNKDIKANPDLLDALIGVYERMLSICTRFSKDDRSCYIIYRFTKTVYRFTIRFHVTLL